LGMVGVADAVGRETAAIARSAMGLNIMKRKSGRGQGKTGGGSRGFYTQKQPSDGLKRGEPERLRFPVMARMTCTVSVD